jgi:uncharacterized protein (UPF0548 family)
MPRRQSGAKRWSTAARWPVGIIWTAWGYMWQTIPVHRWELAGTLDEDSGPPLPPTADLDDIQRLEDGVGTLFHRVYRASIRESDLEADELIGRVAGDLDAVTPSGLASFQRIQGDPGTLRIGDEYVVRMPGPWDGPVRVVAASDGAFRLATLDGHLEAGQIEFRAVSTGRSIEFVIESWARSGDRFSDLLYTNLRMAKEVQLHMWTSVLQRVAKAAHGRLDGGIRVVTRSVAAEAPPGRARRAARLRLADLKALPINFDASRARKHTQANGWHVDDLSVTLPGEPSGEPVDGGSWQTANLLMDQYQVADGHRLQAFFDRDAPLEGRNILLEIRYLLLRFHVGVRIGTPYDEIRVIDKQQVRVLGWSYQTLEGHFEMGELHYEVWKWLDHGDVEFRIHAYSKPATTGPLWRRFGFRILGRHQQLRFYHQAGRRIRRLTESQLDLADAHRRQHAPAR